MTANAIDVRVQAEKFDVGIEMARFTSGDTGVGPDVGAVASFVGLVRGRAETAHDRENAEPDAAAPITAPITAMTLEHYPGMTEKAIAAIADDAFRRWPALRRALIIHRYGRMLPGEPIVLVLTASPHRDVAFSSCQFLMDWLKTKAPFWKLEETPEGARWVDARDSDEAAVDRWGQ